MKKGTKKKVAAKDKAKGMMITKAISQPIKYKEDGTPLVVDNRLVEDTDNESYWNGVLQKGEICFDMSTKAIKIGDGESCWKDLEPIYNEEEEK